MLKQFFQTIIYFLFLIVPNNVQAIVTLPDELRPEYLPTKKILTLTQNVKVEAQVQSIVGDLLSTAMYLTGGVAVIIIIIAGIRYAVSGGEDDQITKAKDTIKWTLVGLLILFTSLSIIRFVVQLTVGVSEL